jgi:lipooligosaccharide transport system permease protein
MRKWQDFDLITVVTLPLFLFSATFFPITVYPPWLQTVVELTPLYRGVHMLRSLTTGTVDAMILVDVAYLTVLGAIGVAVLSRRLRTLILR